MPIEVRGRSRTVRIDVTIQHASWREFISY